MKLIIIKNYLFFNYFQQIKNIKMNNKIEQQSPKKKINYNQIKNNLSLYCKSIQNIIDKKPQTLSPKSMNREINQILKEINNLFDKLIIDKENNYDLTYENLLKRDEKTIRILYSDLLHEKLLKEILEEKIIILLQIQSEYELIKEKTGVIVSDGKVICNERKDNEIMILRTENSTLKNVINDKEKEINLLNEKLKILNHEIIKLKKNKTNINININDINNQPAISKKINNKFITIGKTKDKQLLFNTIYSPNYSSQKEITINNFSSSTKNFYKSYHMNTKLISSKSNYNKNTDKSEEKSNKISNNMYSYDTTLLGQEKLISVNKNIYNNNKISRNKKVNNGNYSSSENILIGNKNKNKLNIKFINNNSNFKKNHHTSKKKLYSPLQEFNSFKYINTNSINNYKDAISSIPKSNRDSNLLNHNLSKQNANVFASSKFLNSNRNTTYKKSEKNLKKSLKGQKNGYLTKNKFNIFRNENVSKESFSVLFQRTYNENFRIDNKKLK